MVRSIEIYILVVIIDNMMHHHLQTLTCPCFHNFRVIYYSHNNKLKEIHILQQNSIDQKANRQIIEVVEMDGGVSCCHHPFSNSCYQHKIKTKSNPTTFN